MIELCQDLWGEWIVKSTWGTLAKRDYGRSNSKVYPDYGTGLDWYEKQKTRREKRGYELVLM